MASPNLPRSFSMRAPGDKVSKRSRHERIVARLANDVAVRISALAEEFQVTTETIRRDLDESVGSWA